MKIKSENFLQYIKKNIDFHNVLLFYGSNFGLVDLLYRDLLSIMSIDVNDPFNVSKIDGNTFKENSSVLVDNISTISILSNKRIVILDLSHNVISNALLDTIINDLKINSSGYVLILKANNLGSQNKLVKCVDSLKTGLLIPCYEENIDNIKFEISKLFNKFRLSFSNNFILTLSSKFSTDSLINEMELKKLENFLLSNSNIDEDQILSSITDNADLNLNKIINFCTSGNIKEALFHLDKIYDNSNTNIILTRAFIKHFKLIEKILLLVEMNLNITDAINRMKPPIFFKQKPFIINQCKIWSLEKINLSLKRLIDLEFKCKTSIYPDKTLIAQFILSTSVIARNSVKT